ncbi:MAG TPA: hypothetical protein VFD67_11710 [Gemmatimonadaceae bacterium]|nr:hypothetical protein [Gemmatimonadaceae bacterium]
METTRRTRLARSTGIITAVLVVGVLTGSCGRSEAGQREMHYITKDYSFTITPSELQPHARQEMVYKFFIRDRETGEPIQNGEGQIYANNKDGARTWDGFTYGPEVGTYYGKLNFVTSGLWAIGFRFRRDSLHTLEKQEWMQEVLNERPSATP